MAQPPLTRDQASEAVERVNAKLREGYRPQGMTGTGPGAISAAAFCCLEVLHFARNPLKSLDAKSTGFAGMTLNSLI